jgi:hypothetical protein
LAEGVALGGHSHTFNSRSVASQLNEKWQKKGVIFGSLDEALVFVNTEACDAAILDLNLSGASLTAS